MPSMNKVIGKSMYIYVERIPIGIQNQRNEEYSSIPIHSPKNAKEQKEKKKKTTISKQKLRN